MPTEELLLTRPDGSESITVKGLYTDHNNEIYFSTGRPVNSRSAHLVVHQDELIDNGFDTNINGFFAEFGGNKYKVRELRSNRTTGLVICMLKDVNG